VILVTAVSSDMAAWYTQRLDEYHSRDFGRLEGVLWKNALKLLPRLHGLEASFSIAR